MLTLTLNLTADQQAERVNRLRRTRLYFDYADYLSQGLTLLRQHFATLLGFSLIYGVAAVALMVAYVVVLTIVEQVRELPLNLPLVYGVLSLWAILWVFLISPLYLGLFLVVNQLYAYTNTIRYAHFFTGYRYALPYAAIMFIFGPLVAIGGVLVLVPGILVIVLFTFAHLMLLFITNHVMAVVGLCLRVIWSIAGKVFGLLFILWLIGFGVGLIDRILRVFEDPILTIISLGISLIFYLLFIPYKVCVLYVAFADICQQAGIIDQDLTLDNERTSE